MNYSPILLFVYNRPKHTKLTLEYLSKNILSSSSNLFIFSDGPKSKNDIDLVNEVRDIIRDIPSGIFKSVTIKENIDKRDWLNR